VELFAAAPPDSMKALLWISTAVLVTVLGSLWLRALPVGADVVPGQAAAPEAAPAPQAVGGKRRSVFDTPRTGPEPAAAPHLELVHELWSVLGTGDRDDAREEARLLRALVEDGSDEALDAVLEALEDRRCVHHADGTALQRLLSPLDAYLPVYHMARRRVEDLTLARGGELAVARVRPWFQLATRHGGEAGTRYVLGFLHEDDVVLRQAGVLAVGQPEHEAGRDLVLLSLLEDEGLAAEAAKLLAFELARTEDEALCGRLFELALDPTGEAARRALLLEFLGPRLTEAHIDGYVLLHRTSGDAVLRGAVVRGLRRLAVGPHLSDLAVEVALAPFVLELVAASDEGDAAQGAELLRDVRALHDVPGAAAAVQARLEGSSATLAAVLNSALAALIR